MFILKFIVYNLNCRIRELISIVIDRTGRNTLVPRKNLTAALVTDFGKYKTLIRNESRRLKANVQDTLAARAIAGCRTATTRVMYFAAGGRFQYTSRVKTKDVALSVVMEWTLRSKGTRHTALALLAIRYLIDAARRHVVSMYGIIHDSAQKSKRYCYRW